MTSLTIVQYLKTIFKKYSLLVYKAIRQGLASFKTYSSVTKTTRHWRVGECYSQSWICGCDKKLWGLLSIYVYKADQFMQASKYFNE